jgi:hypothetical protein
MAKVEFQRMDEIARMEPEREAFLQFLRDPALDFVATLRVFGLLEPNAPQIAEAPNRQEIHLRTHWFPIDPHSKDAWWREWQPIEPILRLGYIKAFEESQSVAGGLSMGIG